MVLPSIRLAVAQVENYLQITIEPPFFGVLLVFIILCSMALPSRDGSVLAALPLTKPRSIMKYKYV